MPAPVYMYDGGEELPSPSSARPSSTGRPLTTLSMARTAVQEEVSPHQLCWLLATAALEDREQAEDRQEEAHQEEERHGYGVITEAAAGGLLQCLLE